MTTVAVVLYLLIGAVMAGAVFSSVSGHPLTSGQRRQLAVICAALCFVWPFAALGAFVAAHRQGVDPQ